ncbi:MAG: YtxH domain-containing protein [Candidatus Manganitrophus sp.]|nr:YtxH domain-containing protein [Candidatus Manganitrophus sp.]
MKNGRFFFGSMMFLFGLLAGVLAGILFAPRSGKETRRRLTGLADETGQRVGRITEATKQVATEAAKHGKEWAAEAGGHLKNIRQEARQTADIIVEQGKELIR